jgi:hypothetical protein
MKSGFNDPFTGELAMKVKLEFELRDEVVDAVIAFGEKRGYRGPGKRKKDRKVLVKRILESKGNEVLTQALGELRQEQAEVKRQKETFDAAT